MPSISSSIIDQNKISDDSIREPAHNERESDRSSDADDDNDVENSTPATKSTAGRRGRKPNPQTPKRATNKRNAASKDSPDENENCRVSYCATKRFRFFTANPEKLYKFPIGCYVHSTAV